MENDEWEKSGQKKGIIAIGDGKERGLKRGVCGGKGRGKGRLTGRLLFVFDYIKKVK